MVVGATRLTSLELNGDGLVGAFHQKPTSPVSQVLFEAALVKFVQHAPDGLASVRSFLPDELHVCGLCSWAPVLEVAALLLFSRWLEIVSWNQEDE